MHLNMKDGFIRVGAATPEIRVADCDYNADRIIELIREAKEKDVSVLVFPELCITGATCGDLFLHKTLLDGAERALEKILEATKRMKMLIVVGMPLAKIEHASALYNCGVIIYMGRILGVAPKRNISEHNDECRYFTSWEKDIESVSLFGNYVARGCSQILCNNIHELGISVEMGGDLLDSDNPSGATVILNPCANPETVGTAEYRRLMAKSQSARFICGVVSANAGCGESTTDLVFAGHNIITENGKILAESKRFSTGLVYTEIDVQKLSSERQRKNSPEPITKTTHIILLTLKKKT